MHGGEAGQHEYIRVRIKTPALIGIFRGHASRRKVACLPVLNGLLLVLARPLRADQCHCAHPQSQIISKVGGALRRVVLMGDTLRR
jgi:hypothetical protein